MKNKIIFLGLMILLFVIGCVEETVQEPADEKDEPEDTAEVTETEEDIIAEPEGVIEDEVKELLEKRESVNSISYKYKGPETENFYYDFYVKDDKIRYLPYRKLKSLSEEDDYNAIYLDKSVETAEAYCDDRQCRFEGKKADLDYGGSYILTPFDWVNGITAAEKTGEELIGSRKTWKITANDGITLWVGTFYGIPLQVEKNGEKYEFSQMVFNGLEDSDVVPG